MEPYRQKQAARFVAMKAARKARILESAIVCAGAVGFQWITRSQVAEHAKTSVGSVNAFFGTMPELKREVLRQAVTREILPIIAQGLVDDHPIVRDAPPELKEKARASL